MGLIDKDVAFDKINKAYGEGNLINLKQVINNIPTVDAVPIVHGRWVVKEKTGELICSNCGIGINASGEMQIILAKKHEHYCYNCGAKMDEKDGESDGERVQK